MPYWNKQSIFDSSCSPVVLYKLLTVVCISFATSCDRYRKQAHEWPAVLLKVADERMPEHGCKLQADARKKRLHMYSSCCKQPTSNRVHYQLPIGYTMEISALACTSHRCKHHHTETCTSKQQFHSALCILNAISTRHDQCCHFSTICSLMLIPVCLAASCK